MVPQILCEKLDCHYSLDFILTIAIQKNYTKRYDCQRKEMRNKSNTITLGGNSRKTSDFSRRKRKGITRRCNSSRAKICTHTCKKQEQRVVVEKKEEEMKQNEETKFRRRRRRSSKRKSASAGKDMRVYENLREKRTAKIWTCSGVRGSFRLLELP